MASEANCWQEGLGHHLPAGCHGASHVQTKFLLNHRRFHHPPIVLHPVARLSSVHIVIIIKEKNPFVIYTCQRKIVCLSNGGLYLINTFLRYRTYWDSWLVGWLATPNLTPFCAPHFANTNQSMLSLEAKLCINRREGGQSAAIVERKTIKWRKRQGKLLTCRLRSPDTWRVSNRSGKVGLFEAMEVHQPLTTILTHAFL